MAYVDFQDSKPIAADTISGIVDDTRQNLMALRDAVIIGQVAGWDYAPSGGTAEQPAEFRYTSGNERLKGVLTWGTSGGADGNVTAVVWYYTANHTANPVTWETISTKTMTYDSDSNLLSAIWS